MAIGTGNVEVRRLTSDIVVRGRDGWLVAIIEVKNAVNLDPKVAVAFRQNLVRHGFVDQRVPYFLLVSQDTGYVWDQYRAGVGDAPPTAVFPMRPVVHHYVPWLTSDDRLSGDSLEFVVASWLSDLAAGTEPPLPEVTQPLAEAGLLDALKDTEVSLNDLA